MKLSEYVKKWEYDDLDYYNDTIGHADLSQPGWWSKGNVNVPPLNFIKSITNRPRQDGKDMDNTYTYGEHPILDQWAEKCFPSIKYKQTLVQLQKPGEKVDPHVDTLHSQIKEWIKAEPGLGDIEHSLEKPNKLFKAVRLFVAVEDHVEGQDFVINGEKWKWKKGDVISLNVWKGLHNTINQSDVYRYMIKITGLDS